MNFQSICDLLGLLKYRKSLKLNVGGLKDKLDDITFRSRMRWGKYYNKYYINRNTIMCVTSLKLELQGGRGGDQKIEVYEDYNFCGQKEG